jgi:hypothetical protein
MIPLAREFSYRLAVKTQPSMGLTSLFSYQTGPGKVKPGCWNHLAMQIGRRYKKLYKQQTIPF